MIRVLIADDEKYIVQMLRQLIDWDGLNLSLAGEAFDGITAYKMICALRPDIVIVDIRMPGYDGISLVEMIEKCDFSPYFIFISGHRQFEYAKFAIEKKVIGYLLKPINKLELNALLQKIVVELCNKMESVSRTTAIQNDLLLLKAQIKKHELEKLLFNDDNSSSVRDLIIQYDFLPTEESLRIIIIKVDSVKKDKLDDSIGLLYDYLSSSLGTELLNEVSGETLLLKKNREIILYINLAFDNDRFLENMQTLFIKATDFLQKLDDHHLTICVGSPVSSIDRIGVSYRDAKKLMKTRCISGIDRVMYYKSSALEYTSKHPLTKIEYLDFIRAIQLKSKAELKSIIDSIFACRNIYFRDVPSEFTSIILDLINLFFTSILRDQQLQCDVAVETSRIKQELDDCFTISQTINVLYDFFIDILSELDSENIDDNAAIKIAKKYIDENYQKKLDLKTIATIVHYNPVYLSIAFKKATGINFNLYLTHVRIEKAKELLLNIQLNISEVSALVGYSDVRHFSSTFKKVVGLTPKQYRNLRAIV